MFTCDLTLLHVCKQELPFQQRDGILCVPNVFIFVTGKEHNIQTNKNIVLHHLKKKKKNLDSHR